MALFWKRVNIFLCGCDLFLKFSRTNLDLQNTFVPFPQILNIIFINTSQSPFFGSQNGISFLLFSKPFRLVLFLYRFTNREKKEKPDGICRAPPQNYGKDQSRYSAKPSRM